MSDGLHADLNSLVNAGRRIQTVPSNIVASMFHFTAAEYFEITDPEARESIKVEF